MDEYFISYYGCESKTKNDTGRRCTKCSDICNQKKLLYRVRLWDLTDEEVELYKEKVAASGGFTPVITPVSALKNVIGSYVMHGAKEIPMNTLRARQEHAQARENALRLHVFHEFEDQAQAFVRFQQIACDVRKLRYGVVLDSCFTDKKTIATFYQIEVAIIKKVAGEKIQAVRREKKKLEREKKKLDKEITRLATEETVLKNDYGAWIKSQRQELEAIQKNNTATIAESIAENGELVSQDDIADLINETKWRLVSPADFVNTDINGDPNKPFSERALEESRQNEKITWLDESQGIGRDADGRYLKQTKKGKGKNSFRYSYFLRSEFYKEPNERNPS